MTIPNLLTMLRIILTPVLVWLLLNGRLNTALAVFFIAGLTDALDGLFARVLRQKSRLGAYLDPFADKFLLVSSFVLLGQIGLIPCWLAAIAVGRDVIIVVGLMALIFHHVSVEIQPLLLSKLTTLFQLMSILAALSSSLVPLPAWCYEMLFATTALFSIGSGVQYVRKGISLYERHRLQHHCH
jgi:cardiolipin synthase